MNQETMVQYENQVADYLRLTKNHVQYRVTPYYKDNELLCRGVQMEAQNVEDSTISYNVFIYNVEDGYTLDYATGNTKNDYGGIFLDKMRLFQNGTMQMLSEGLLDGTITLQELLKYGDTGIGTGEGIDGELVILDNTGYKIDENGTAKELDKNFNVVFADIHQGNYEYFDNFENIDLSHLMEQMKKNINGENYFFSIKLHGLFTKVKTRSTRKYSKPYPSLEEIAKNQIEFYAENIYGTLISYYTPIIYQGVTVAGFHSHFISDDKSMGGHVISANIGSVETCYQKFESFTQKFPLDSNSFTNADLSNTQNLDSIIKNVE